jgi:hypothetical protein
MEFREKFNSIDKPSENYNGKFLDEAKFSNNIYVAKNKDDRNCFLIRVQKEDRPFRAPDLQDINIKFQVKCTIATPDGIDSDYWIIIEFISDDDYKEDLFFTQMTSVFSKLSFPCKASKVSSLLQALIDLFKLLSQPGKSKKQGLWAELYLIYKSIDPIKLMRYWHVNANEKYDFSDHEYRVEVKSCGTSNYRKHKFSHRQTHPAQETEVIIASVITEEVSNGLSLQSIYEFLKLEMTNEPELLQKLDFQCVETLGRDFQKSMSIAFDEQQAEESLEFFDLKSIPKLERELPDGIEELSFSSDFSFVNSIDKESYAKKSSLFSLSISS